MDQSQTSEPISIPEPTAAKPWQARHDVQFYDNQEFLASSVATFLAEGIKSAQPAIVIATPGHTRLIQAELRKNRVDIDALGATNMMWLDARDTLASFMEGGRPSAELFDVTVGNAFEKITSERRYVTVRAFGEMVDLLWRDGKMQAALELEELWNGLASRYSFALLCAYAASSLHSADMHGVERICAVHNQVLPSRPLA